MSLPSHANSTAEGRTRQSCTRPFLAIIIDRNRVQRKLSIYSIIRSLVIVTRLAIPPLLPHPPADVRALTRSKISRGWDGNRHIVLAGNTSRERVSGRG